MGVRDGDNDFVEVADGLLVLVGLRDGVTVLVTVGVFEPEVPKDLEVVGVEVRVLVVDIETVVVGVPEGVNVARAAVS